MRSIEHVADRIGHLPIASGLHPPTPVEVPGSGVRHLAAGFAWALVFGYLLAELVTATAWKSAYSFRYDTISDLGITTCTPHACSPLHLLMNATFVALGLVTIAGAVVFRDYVPHGPRQWSVVALAVIIGLSTAATGFFPSNDGIVVHVLAVLPGFVSRHIVLILLAIWLWKHRRLAALWSAFCASAGIVGAVLMVIGLQVGITERLVLYPLPIWMAVTGALIALAPLRNVVRAMRSVRPPTGGPPAEPTMQRPPHGAGSRCTAWFRARGSPPS
ncbi:DUF998 domain-containing protein [Nocardia testacea]|uniref:DUF998 domain-containing protein n=1 Tax=Nocardia testacea TaxID=248551 RepID=UPI003A8381ED